jgi:L-2-hydroxyglutarate oxidase LhgO
LINKTDFIIVGAGVIGLSISLKLLKKKFSVLLVEKNPTYGMEASSHNSGVIHSGAYYKANSHKHQLCIKGKDLMYEYLSKKNIPYLKTGKLFISLSNDEESLLKIHDQAKKNGLNDLSMINQNQIKNIDSKILSKIALLCPSSGILDQKALLSSLYEDCNTFSKFQTYFGSSINEIDVDKTIKVSLDSQLAESSFLINSTGRNSIDFLKKKLNYKTNMEAFPVIGGYLDLKKSIKLNTIVYTSLNPGNISERVDVTPTLNDNMIFGPSIDHNEINSQELLKKFRPSIRKYLDIDDNELKFSYYGVRPKAKLDGQVISDFLFFKSHKNIINLINFESPALTSTFSISNFFYEKYL